MRRPVMISVGLFLVWSMAPGGLPTGQAVGVAAATAPGCSPAVGMLQDAFAIGSPRRAVDGVRQAGVVEVRGLDGTLRRTLTSPMLGVPAGPKAHFGSARAIAHVTSGDECKDLVVGVPGAGGRRGAVAIIPDFGRGLEPAAAVWLPTRGLGMRRGDALGTSVVATHTGGETGSVLIVAGAPGRDRRGARDSGAVVSWTVRWTKTATRTIRASAPTVHVQGRGRIPDKAERRDRFGTVLAPLREIRPGGLKITGTQVLVGVPDEDVGRHRDAGAMTTLTFSLPGGTVSGATQQWQGHGLPGSPKTGDRLGAAVVAEDGDSFAIGVPGEDADGRRDSGAVIVHQSGPDGRGPGSYHVITQDTRRVPGASERGDRFGSAVATAGGFRFDNSWTFAVGAPGENVGRLRDAGAVTYIRAHEEPEPLTFGQQPVTGLAPGDRFGSRFEVTEKFIESDDPDEVLIIGVPGRDLRGVRDAGGYVMPQRRKVNPFLNGVARAERLGSAASTTGAFTVM